MNIIQNKNKNKIEKSNTKWNKKVSQISASLMLFNLAIFGNYIGDITSPDLIKLMDKRKVRLVVSFIILLYTINLYNDSDSFLDVVKSAVFIWLLFIIISKQHLKYSLSVIVLLMINYTLYQKTERLNEKEDAPMIEFYYQIQKYIFYLICVISLCGGYKYFVEHKNKYFVPNESILDFLYLYFME